MKVKLTKHVWNNPKVNLKSDLVKRDNAAVFQWTLNGIRAYICQMELNEY